MNGQRYVIRYGFSHKGFHFILTVFQSYKSFPVFLGSITSTYRSLKVTGYFSAWAIGGELFKPQRQWHDWGPRSLDDQLDPLPAEPMNQGSRFVQWCNKSTFDHSINSHDYNISQLVFLHTERWMQTTRYFWLTQRKTKRCYRSSLM